MFEASELNPKVGPRESDLSDSKAIDLVSAKAHEKVLTVYRRRHGVASSRQGSKDRVRAPSGTGVPEERGFDVARAAA